MSKTVQSNNERLALGSDVTPAGSTGQRRHFLQAMIGAAVAGQQCLAMGGANAAPPANQKRKTGLLARSPGVVQTDTRCKIVLELDGELQIDEPDPNKVERIRKAEVKGKSTLEYYEKVSFAEGDPVAAARRYSAAKTENWIGGSASTFELRDECRSTLAMRHDGRWQQYCAREQLTSREVELLDAPINSSALELLLPIKPAKPDASWALAAEDAKELFNLEAVHKASVTSKITKVEKGKATIQIAGELSGTANSVPTKLSIKGNYQVTMGRQGAMVTWVGMVVKEDRSISEAEPGFNITAQIKLLRAETTKSLATSAESLRNLASREDDGRWLVTLSPQHGHYTMLAGRKWAVYVDGTEETIFRMVENNMVIAQCNVNRLNELGKGQQLTLEGLQEEIQQSLGKGFESFLESSEKLTSSGLRLVRVVAIGMRENVPVQWVYDHLSDDSGKRISMVYTMGGNVTDRFAASDEQMTASFRFLTPPVSDTPTPASRLSSTPQNTKR